jgi:hypothetical protein
MTEARATINFNLEQGELIALVSHTDQPLKKRSANSLHKQLKASIKGFDWLAAELDEYRLCIAFDASKTEINTAIATFRQLVEKYINR